MRRAPVALQRLQMLALLVDARAYAEHHTVQGETAVPFYEKGDVRSHYEEAGSGFPLFLIPGGGLNSTIAFFTGNAPFNAIEAFQGR
jgi:hypothetical protein